MAPAGLSASLNGTYSEWGVTTASEWQQDVSALPYTTPALQANLFFRVFLGIIATFITLVPARLLWINREFAATVICIDTSILNFIYVVNSLIWQNNDTASWYRGYGWCDLQTYIFFALQTIWHISLFEIMRSLASRIGNLRVTRLTAQEKQRKVLISSFVIFTIPLIQVILTYPLILQRYNISTLLGCTNIYDTNGLFFAFFTLPSPLFAIGAGILAVVTFKRYRQVDKLTREAVQSDESVQSARQHRVRRKLYFMTLSILVIIVPVVTAFFISNILEGFPWTRPYDFNRIHYGPDPFNERFISFTTSDNMSFGNLAVNYLTALAGIVIFISFGTTTEAYNCYRRILLAFGLGRIFPKLHNEYFDRPPREGKRSWLSSMTRPLAGRALLGACRSRNSTRKEDTTLPTTEHVSMASRSSNKAGEEGEELTFITTPDTTLASTSTRTHNYDHYSHHHPDPRFPDPVATICSPPRTNGLSNNNHNPWPDLTEEEMAVHDAALSKASHHCYRTQGARNPWSFPMAPTTPIRFPYIHINKPSSMRHKKRAATGKQQESPLEQQNHQTHNRDPSDINNSVPPPSFPSASSATCSPPWRVDTRVWPPTEDPHTTTDAADTTTGTISDKKDNDCSSSSPPALPFPDLGRRKLVGGSSSDNSSRNNNSGVNTPVSARVVSGGRGGPAATGTHSLPSHQSAPSMSTHVVASASENGAGTGAGRDIVVETHIATSSEEEDNVVAGGGDVDADGGRARRAAALNHWDV